jgi:hypothetical protein
MLRRILTAFVLSFVTSTLLAAGVSGQTVAVMRIDGQAVPYNTLGQLSRAVSAGVLLAGHSVAESASDSTLNEVLLLIGCSTVTPECLSELATTFEAPLLVYGSARPMSGGVELQLTAFDSRVPRMVFSVALPIVDGLESSLVEVTASLLADQGVALVRSAEAGASLIDANGEVRSLPCWVTGLSGEPATYAVRLANGREIALSLEADGPTVQTVEARGRGRGTAASGSSAPMSATAIAGWATFGAGVATGAVATYFGVRTNALQSDFDAELRQRQARELASDGLKSARATNIAVAVSAALVATGTTLLVVGRPREQGSAAMRSGFFADARGLGLQF